MGFAMFWANYDRLESYESLFCELFLCCLCLMSYFEVCGGVTVNVTASSYIGQCNYWQLHSLMCTCRSIKYMKDNLMDCIHSNVI
jgi:hypothetical protein